MKEDLDDMTNDDVVRSIAERLSAGRIGLRGGELPDWEREAALLVAAAEDDDPRRHLDRLVANRLRGVPLGYLVGTETFLGAEFEVEPGVIIPHPATELLAMLAVHAVDRCSGEDPHPGLLEIGVGVGVVAVSVLRRRPTVRAYCSELSGAALRLTRANAARLLAGPYELNLYQGYFTDEVFPPFDPDPPRQARVVVSNPPYLIEGDEVSDATKKSGLAHLSYSPVNDPSWFLRRVADAPDGMLAPDCSLLMECASWYAADHESVLREAGWQVEIFDRQKYVSGYGSADLREMKPTAHRVLHAWRGEDGSLNR